MKKQIKKKPVIKQTIKRKKPRYKDLPEKERMLILKLVRRYIVMTGMASELGLGLEHCEEIVIGMLEDNTLRIVLTKDMKTYTIEPNEIKWRKNVKR